MAKAKKADGIVSRVVKGAISLGHSLGLVKSDPGFLGQRVDQFTQLFTGQDPWLSPGSPLVPKEPEGTNPRQFQVPPGYNIAIQPRSTEQITFQQLRALSEIDIIRLLIERVKNTLKAHEWDVVADDENLNQQYEGDILATKKFLEKPDRRHDWDEWLGMVLDEALVIDAPSIYVHKSYSGSVWGLEVIDGATIKVLADERGMEPMGFPGFEPPAYQQFLFGVPYCNLTRDELIYRPMNRRVNHFYGFSPVEQLAITINMIIRRELGNLAQFTDGNIPEAFGNLPADWKPAEIREWAKYWDAVLAGDPQNRAKVRWMPGGPGVGITKMKDDEIFGLFNKWDEWVARKACFAFGLSPMAFIQLNNRSAAQEMGDQEAENGIATAKNYIERLMNHIIDNVLMMPHLCFRWITDRGALQSKRVTANTEYAKVGAKQIDEIRQEEGLQPFGLPPGMVTASGYVPFPIPGSPYDPAVIAANQAAAQAAYGPQIDPMTGMPVAPPDPFAAQASAGYAAAAKALAAARLDELEKWERFCVTRLSKGVSIPEFKTVYVSAEEAWKIRGELAKAKFADEIRHIFNTRRMAKPPVRLAPPKSGDGAHLKEDLRSTLRRVLIAEAESAAKR